MNVRAREIAGVAALIGDPARARMLTSLLSGRALTATELALAANIAPSTASAHLAKLTVARVLAVETQGRHRYFRLFDASIADMLEDLAGIAANQVPVRRTGPADPAERASRVCYDHLAGELGVWLLDTLRACGALGGRDGLTVTPDGEARLTHLAIDVDLLASSRRPLCRTCLDWSERRHHLGGSLGAAILSRVLSLGWARRATQGRAILFSSSGLRSLRGWIG